MINEVINIDVKKSRFCPVCDQEKERLKLTKTHEFIIDMPQREEHKIISITNNKNNQKSSAGLF